MSKTEDFNKTAYVMNQTIAEVYFQFVKDNNLRELPEQNFHPRVTSKIRWEDLDDDNSNHSRKSRNSFASFYENFSIVTYSRDRDKDNDSKTYVGGPPAAFGAPIAAGAVRTNMTSFAETVAKTAGKKTKHTADATFGTGVSDMTDFPGIKAVEVKMNNMVIKMAEQRKESEALRKENKMLIDALKLRDDPEAASATPTTTTTNAAATPATATTAEQETTIRKKLAKMKAMIHHMGVFQQQQQQQQQQHHQQVTTPPRDLGKRSNLDDSCEKLDDRFARKTK